MIEISAVERQELEGLMEVTLKIECTLCSEAFYSDDYSRSYPECKAVFAKELIGNGWHSARYDDTIYICCKKCGTSHE